MKTTLRTAIPVLILSLSLSLGAAAQSFTVRTADGNALRVSVKDSIARTVQLVGDPSLGVRTGVIEIPEKVLYKRQLYKVTTIGEGTLGPEDSVTQVIIPASVDTIAAHAFQGCKSLTGIVFSERDVFIGEEALRGTSLTDVSFGSSWKKVDLKEFRYVSTLREIYIPAQVTQITGLKGLEYLERIVVDGNNRRFKSIDGMLYDYTATTLYSCPRNRAADVVVPEGVVTVLNNAFNNCNSIAAITLPSTLKSLSFMEFENCKSLVTLTMKAPEPIHTANIDGKDVFTLKVPLSLKALKVERKAVPSYKAALVTELGLYKTLDGKLESALSKGNTLSAKQIKSL